MEIKGTEVKSAVTTAGGVEVFVAEAEDGTRLVITKHTDGTRSVRIGRGGHGPKFELSAKASAEAAEVLS